MSDFGTALGLVLVLEGVFYALLPETLPRMAARLAALAAATIRRAGLLAAIVGVVLVRLVQG